jgi:hypothetical protein
MTYQENMLVEQNIEDGHEVLVLTDCHAYVHGKYTAVSPGIFCDGDVTIERLNFSKYFLPSFISKKIKVVENLYSKLERFRPDIVFYHNLLGFEMVTVARYKKANPNVRFYVDNHADFFNSPKYSVSTWLHYRFFSKMFYALAKKEITKVFYISIESGEFLKRIFSMKEDDMEFYPLGGVVICQEERRALRFRVRQSINVSESAVVFIHAGKFNGKKKTIETLKSFSRVNDENIRMLLVGDVDESIAKEFFSLIKQDPRMLYLGWLSGDQLRECLAASDCYVQPGTQSANLQVAICYGLPIVVADYASHIPFLQNNGFILKSDEELDQVIDRLRNRHLLTTMSDASLRLARNMLDYRIRAQRLYL